MEKMRGLELSRRFYEEFGREMVRKEFPEYEERIAAGLVGQGSECFGYDDEVSRDHDFGPEAVKYSVSMGMKPSR